MRLTFPGFDDKRIRVAHGLRCAVLMIERPVEATLIADDLWEMHAAVVLTATEARALGRRLIQQAAASERFETSIPEGDPR